MLRSVLSTIKIIMLTHFQNSDPNLHVVLAGLQLLHKMCNNCIPTGAGVLCFLFVVSDHRFAVDQRIHL